jgi:hypothetical protein
VPRTKTAAAEADEIGSTPISPAAVGELIGAPPGTIKAFLYDGVFPDTQWRLYGRKVYPVRLIVETFAGIDPTAKTRRPLDAARLTAPRYWKTATVPRFLPIALDVFDEAEDRGLTPRDMSSAAARLGVNPKTLGDWETRRRGNGKWREPDGLVHGPMGLRPWWADRSLEAWAEDLHGSAREVS